jgi:acyl-CoA thioesterase
MVPGPGPFSTLLGFRLVSASDGVAVMEADPGPEHANGGGILHGGYLTSLLDSTTGWAVHSTMADGAAPHVHLTVQFLRAGVPGRPLRAEGRCSHAGRRTATAEAEVVQDGRVLARAVTSHAVLVAPPAP